MNSPHIYKVQYATKTKNSYEVTLRSPVNRVNQKNYTDLSLITG